MTAYSNADFDDGFFEEQCNPVYDEKESTIVSISNGKEKSNGGEEKILHGSLRKWGLQEPVLNKRSALGFYSYLKLSVSARFLYCYRLESNYGMSVPTPIAIGFLQKYFSHLQLVGM
ncbi:hypothetical protein ETB97_009546 [Aspergillus alliaceus]|uniref:Uncharacterized protein n=1 Tax=Petromyces alliaceus TaxID=209559 RepID=A0A8H6E1Z5_PETAA|nr:hypothetical protein ETB97_009546 [Aspergillus burnettii]